MDSSPSQGPAGIQLKSTKFKLMSGSAENPLEHLSSLQGAIIFAFGFLPTPLNLFKYFPLPFSPGLM